MEDSKRSERYIGRWIMRRVASDDRERCKSCGVTSVNSGGSVQVRRDADGRVGYAGIASCGMIWLCPVCNAKVMARRAVEIGAVLTWAVVQGLQVIWGSLTCWHNAQSDLEDLVTIQQKAWRYLVQGRAWKSANAVDEYEHECVPGCSSQCKAQYDYIDSGRRGRVGYIRASEINYGKANGWHPHFHPIMFYRGTREQAQAFADATVARWVVGVERAGGHARVDGAQQLRVLDPGVAFDALAGYVTKQTFQPEHLALETVWSQGKTGRGRVKETASHWSLLAPAMRRGEADSVLLWWELEAATDGHRMVTWSRGIRKMAQLGEEKKDEEIAAEEIGSKDDAVCVITAAGWMTVLEEPELAGLVLDVLEQGGWDALRPVLDLHGIEWLFMGDTGDVSHWLNEEWADAARDEEELFEIDRLLNLDPRTPQQDALLARLLTEHSMERETSR